MIIPRVPEDVEQLELFMLQAEVKNDTAILEISLAFS